MTETGASVTGEPDASGRGPYAKGVARRRQIIESAIAEFAERGVDGTSLRTLGEAIGVSHATLRHYFASRDELLVEVYRAHEERDPADSPSDRGAVEVMTASADINRAIPGLVRLYATLTTDALQEDHPASREFIRERFRAVREDLARRIRDGQASGRIASDIDATDAAALVIAASDGLQVQWLLDPDEVDVRRALTLLERLLPGSAG
ncbi:TetR/AcrR family transcriptional regulator [Gryllotalpicola daejeonensis]|uniref:TetR/AcrR family transcriptional regulator n=1 Tax=Gryllotalpicola daejeonensis TaxID=993087 RepID=A0ABP7ZMU9_9MICO